MSHPGTPRKFIYFEREGACKQAGEGQRERERERERERDRQTDTESEAAPGSELSV